MSEPIDLMSATQAAMFARLAAAIAPETASVHDHVKQDAAMPFVRLGQIDSEGVGGKGEQEERFEVEVQTLYRGTDRSELLAILHRVRLALDGAELTADQVEFTACNWLGSAASDAAGDGVTYAGISSFEVFAEPA